MTRTRSNTLLGDLRQLIAEARQDVARQVNSALVLLYWRIGKRMRRDVPKESERDTGDKLSPRWGDNWKGGIWPEFDEKSLRHMVRFAEVFLDGAIVSGLGTEMVEG